MQQPAGAATPAEDYPDAHALASPLRMRGPVIRGFGRGSKQLGIPTANLGADSLPGIEAVPAGVYFGWASVGNRAEVYKMVMSIGWNPYFKNERKTVEPHLLHEFKDDFYDEELRLVVTGYLRPERNFSSLETLISAIHADIALASASLDAPPHDAARGDAGLCCNAETAPAPP